MYHTTGLARDEIVELCALIHSDEAGPDDKKWPPSLGLFDSVVITLTYLRRNRVQEELAETYGTSQPTVSRSISVITPLIKKVLAPYVPTAEDLDQRCQYLVDGTLLPCWSWASRQVDASRGTVGIATIFVEQIPVAWMTVDGDREPEVGDIVRIVDGHLISSEEPIIIRADRSLTSVWRVGRASNDGPR
ncbi:MAG: transposase family protein [Streptosporangiaceae bacterium]